MKTLLEGVPFRGEIIDIPIEFDYAVEDGGLIVYTVESGGRSIKHLLTHKEMRQLLDASERHYQMWRECRDKTKGAMKEIVEAARAEYFDDPVSRARG